MQSNNFREYWESGFLELAFLDGFTGNITALASATVVFIECMSMAFAYEYDHNL